VTSAPSGISSDICHTHPVGVVVGLSVTSSCTENEPVPSNVTKIGTGGTTMFPAES
jgi:hypothetical protein